MNIMDSHTQTKRKIYKCGLTKQELRNYWKDLIYILNLSLAIENIPMMIITKKYNKIDLVIAAIKKMGITVDLIKLNNDFSNPPETREIIIKMFKTPKKYMITK